MEGFLAEVARDLYERTGGDPSGLSVLFPSRRARLFFVDALARIAERPMWQPRWLTVDDLMTEISGLRIGDRVRLIAELYKVYSRYHTESFDKFYFWGDMLLTDFDTVDKYLIDAGMLFRNLSDIKELEADISYLTPEQLKILSFWSTFGEGTTLSEEKRRFLAIWNTLCAIYREFRERLAAAGFAYNGMVQRAAAERLREGGFAFGERRHYVVAGFNALTECEKRLFKFLAATSQTDFYWDYDDYYTECPEQEAGMFVRTNLALFPPRAPIAHDHFRRPKELTVVSAVSNAVQCKYAARVLSELAARGPLDKRTAVVLTDENLLLPLLYALPPEVGKVNVTMGYPLRQTLAYTFVERLVELQNHCRVAADGHATFYHADVEGVLSHPYVVADDPGLARAIRAEIVERRRISVEAAMLCRSELLTRLFTPAGDWRERSRYLLDAVGAVARVPCDGEERRRRTEFLSAIAEELVKLRNSLDACEVKLTAAVYDSLLRRHLQTLRIPYEGEPLEGVQIMGILETRNLDFRNVVILSMNDDNFPGNRLQQGSFIPYNLRAAYGMPTPEHHEGVYAYYFYRLIQRAERVTMLYCSHADEKSTGEPSRYIYQLGYESGFPLRRIEAGVDVNLAPSEPIEVAKDARAMRSLARFLDAGGADPDSDQTDNAALSPTALARYVACPLQFYFHSVARLRSGDELSEGVDAPMFGVILHDAAQRLYARVEGVARPGELLRAIAASGEVERAVVGAINENYLQRADAGPETYSGELLLVRDIVVRYLERGVMAWDAAHDGFAVRGLERDVTCGFPLDDGDRPRRVKFAGRSDRIDSLDDGTLRVVDYKTGRDHLVFDGVERLFTGKGRHRMANVLQTLLYAMMLYRSEGRDAVPALYYVRNMHRPDYSPLLEDKETGLRGAPYSCYRERFEELLRAQLTELFDPAVPFWQCEDADTCQYCDFNAICRR